MCQKALDWGADLIVQLDADQVYESDTLIRLLKRFDEGYQIVAAMVPGRGYRDDSKMKPFQRFAWRSKDNYTDFEVVEPSEGEIIEVDFPTSACILFSAEDLKKLNKPWYYNKFDPLTYEMLKGEDGDFFVRMKYLGIKSYVDTTIKVKHAHIFEIDETFPDRFADWAEKGKGDSNITKYTKGE